MAEQLTFEFNERPTIKGFPELRWTGKRPYRSTQYFPAQLRERYGEEQDGWINKIYWGDNLQVMSHLLNEFRGKVDLIYIDPPFDSKADYKKKISLRGQTVTSDSSSFEEKQYGDIWTNDEYLQFMYERLIILRELLSETGSIYLHCDYHKNQYLRCLLDEVFGMDNFINEITWKRRGGALNNFKSLGQLTDTIYLYCKNNGTYKFNAIKTKDTPEVQEYIRQRFVYDDGDGRKYSRDPVTNPSATATPSLIYEYKGYQPPEKGWAFSRQTMEEWDAKGKLYFPPEKTQRIRRKTFLDDYEGQPLQNYWGDIYVINSQAKESLAYPTQKPEDLLDRIIRISSNPGDLVFDCFMGSGTTQAVAMKLGRRFIGADINLGAIQITTKRLISLAVELRTTEPEQLTMIASNKKEKLSKIEYTTEHGYASRAAEESGKYLGDNEENEETESTVLTEAMPFTSFEVYNVNNYEFFRNPVEARDLLIDALEIQSFPQRDVWDGELDGRMVKIMPVNRIATKADLEELKANLPYKTYEKRKDENPNQPVERITIVCMGHEPDLKASLEKALSEYKLDIEIVDILRDKADLQLKRESEADIAIEDGRLAIRAFYPLNLMQKLSLQKEYVEDWRQLVESVMIDWNYDGVVMQPTVTDVPGKKNIVKGIYDIPEGVGTIKVKITDLLSESLETEVR